MGRKFYVYIMSNTRRTVLYIGVTNSIERRFIEHTFHKERKAFTAKYNVCDLLYFEEYSYSLDAIAREKQLKKWGRQKKLDVIQKNNPGMRDLFGMSRDLSTPCGRSR